MRFGEISEATSVEKQANAYVKPFLTKWHQALQIQAKKGANIEDRAVQQSTLGGIIARYAKLGDDDVAPLEQKIMAADLTNDQQVADILRTAVMMTLYQRIAKSGAAQPVAPAGQSATAPATTAPKQTTIKPKRLIPGQSKVSYVGKEYTWVNNAWRSGTEVLRGKDAQAATEKFRKMR